MRSSGPKKILGGYGGGDWDLQVGALLHSELMKVAKRVLDSSQSDNRVCCQPVGPSEGAQRGVGYVLSFEQIPPSTRKTRALMRVHMQTNTWIIAVQVAYTVQMGKPLDALRESQAQSQLQSQVANKSGGWQRAGGEGEGSAPVFELDSFNLTANDPKTAAQLLMAYLSLNSRVAPLILTVKAWAKERGFFSPWPHNPPAVQTQKGGTSQASAPDVNQKKGAGGSMSVVAGLSGYAWTFLVIFFLLQPAGGPRPVPELIQMFARSGGLGIAEAGGTRTAGAGEEEEKEKEREWNPKEDPVPLPVSSMEVQRSPILPPLQRAVGIERSEGSLRGNAKPEGGGGTGSADSGEGNLVSVVRGRRGELSKGERRSVQEIKKEKKREREAELTECEFFTSWPSSREGGGEAAADASGSAAEVSAAGAGRRRRTGGGGSGGRPPRGGGISWPVFDCPPVSGSSLLRLFSEFLLFLVQTEFQCWVLSVRQGAAIPSSHPALSSFFESGGAMYLEDPVSGENLAASLGADRLREMKTAADLSLRLLDSVLRGEGEGEGHTSAPMPSVEDALTTILGGLPTKGLAGKPVRSLALESLKPVV
uniref:Uncharacterized protein n=1 Tax=Chromera velia CCMP2878 TaxID=1169474 RepID=A0A0G4FFG1_9ALVE|eukprot:Cvel_16706.t1-p1 / transcript=Cvel_16706.t1 / gene=Cvel_16706 / organism=Chromera_velia_CCMP2878 / gene_product=hypothetical protein / transcript_product=hypothetical protein / location=Cvel_scaffold1297:47983-49961(-) / protein_length=591 / sequence_SO=supercontig / SO=protein_coding / is_pseudo=false